MSNLILKLEAIAGSDIDRMAAYCMAVAKVLIEIKRNGE